MSNIKTSQLKITYNKHITLLSDTNVPVRFRAQQRAKYRSLQLTANCIPAKRCLRHCFKLIWESPTTADRFPPSNAPFRSKLQSYFFNSCNQGNIQAFGSLGCSDDKNWLDLSRFRSLILLQVLIPREATLESSLTVVWFSRTNHKSLLRIATNDIASFCIGNRLRQMAFFVFANVGKRGRLSLKDFEIKPWNK